MTPNILANPVNKNEKSALLIKSTCNTIRDSKTKIEQINQILSKLNLKKAASPDKILPKIVQHSADISDCHLT